jgi:hypothetical protein
MLRHSLISIIEHLEAKRALEAERKVKNFHTPPNGAIISGRPNKNGLPQKDVFENEQVRVSAMSVPKGTGWSAPHDGRDRVVVLLDIIKQAAETNEKDSSPFVWRVTWIPANSDLNVANESDQIKNLMILEFKDTAAEQALVRQR